MRFSQKLIMFAAIFLLTAPACAQIEPLVEKETKKNKISSAKAPEIKSLFFSDSDIKLIYDARKFYEQNHHIGKSDGSVVEDDFLRSLEKISASKFGSAPNLFTYPQFFLSSIIYHSVDDWVVWINDKKITQNSGVTTDGLRIINIDKGKVVFQWKPQKMDRIADIGESSQDSPVRVNQMKGTVEFLLQPNQTFSSYAMRIVEGRVQPVTINLNDGMIVSND